MYNDLNRSHVYRAYPLCRPGVIRESLLDKLKRLLCIGHPYKKEKEEAAPPGCWSRGWVYAYVPERKPK